MNKLHDVVQILKAAGWKDTCDAQWDGIEAALPELAALLSCNPPAVAVPDEHPNDTQWWLVSLDQHGNPNLEDGAHRSRDGANQALYLINSLNLGRGQKFAAAKVQLFDAVPSSEGVNHDALAVLSAAQKPEGGE